MHTLRKHSWLLCSYALVFILVLPALAQTADQLVLSLSRDFGYSGFNGNDIQGTFSMKVNGPDNLQKVDFYIDGAQIGEDTEAPYRMQFTTDSYSLGIHELSAKGTTSDGQVLQSEVVEKNFVSAQEGWKTVLEIVIPLLIVVLAISLLSIVGPMLLGRNKKDSIPLGTPRHYGVAGGTICSRCGRPFALNFFGLNLFTGKLVRCPHCGKVGIMSRRSLPELQKAEEAELAMAAGDAPQVQGMTEEEKLQKELDESRYQGM